jgi:hypothetical protein
MKGPRTRNAYISASATTDTGSVRELLREMGVHPYDAFDFEAGARIDDLIRSRIQASDLVIGMLDRPSPNVWYELGLARGLGKPVLLLSQPDVDIPIELQGDIRLRSSKFDDDVVRMAIRRFVENALSSKQAHASRSSKRKTTSAGPPQRGDVAAVRRADRSLHHEEAARIAREFGESRSQLTGPRAADLAAEMFRISGVTAVSGSADEGADFAVWSEGLTYSIGNPILVDIKVGDIEQAQLQDIERQLSIKSARANVRLALLLYLDRRGRRVRSQGSVSPFVFSYDLEDFARALASHSFDSILLEHRNRVVHGIGD